jgi:hypothetical protein
MGYDDRRISPYQRNCLSQALLAAGIDLIDLLGFGET